MIKKKLVYVSSISKEYVIVDDIICSTENEQLSDSLFFRKDDSSFAVFVKNGKVWLVEGISRRPLIHEGFVIGVDGGSDSYFWVYYEENKE